MWQMIGAGLGALGGLLGGSGQSKTLPNQQGQTGSSNYSQSTFTPHGAAAPMYGTVSVKSRV